MAHEIRESDKFVEVRSNGERAWHGLGIELEEGLSAADAFKFAGLDWRTELAPLSATLEPDLLGEERKRVAIETHYAHVRLDTFRVLGIVSGGYTPVENMELAEFADALLGADAAVTVETAGSLYDGKRVYCLVRLPQDIVVTDQDVLEQYVLLQNGHGGTAAFSTYPTSIRVVCANTLRWSERDVSRGIRFQHTGNLDQKIAQAKTALGLAVVETERFEKHVRALVGIEWSLKQAKAYMESLWDEYHGGIPVNDADAAVKAIMKKNDMVAHWLELMDHPNNAMAGVRGTAWAGYNAVSQWSDHERGNTGPESDGRIQSNLFGASNKDKVRAFRKALQTA